MQLSFKIGAGIQHVDVDEETLLGVLMEKEYPAVGEEKDLIEEALRNPIGTPPLKEIVRRGQKVAIVTSDITRPMPTWKVMPYLLKELYAAGIQSENITLVFALGSHRKQSAEEKRHLAGEQAWREIRCVDADTKDCIHIGTTSMGTPVDLDRRVVEADIRICLGNIEFHYFAGYSGGAKAIMPGISTREAIQANHSRMILPEACAGNLEHNPLRKDIEEAADMLGVDFMFNVVLDSDKRIVKAVAGDITKAHRVGCEFLDKIYKREIEEKADIVIVSQGGAPKDLNLYQTQKALANAKHAVKNGGIIILIGACNEGIGEETFEEWLISAETSHSLIERIQKEFVLGGHKAAAIAMVLEFADIYLVSQLEDELVKKIFMKPFSMVQEAFEAARNQCGTDATVLAMPYGGSTLPYYINK